MPEFGEPIAPPQFLEEGAHSESTCPWHPPARPPRATPMDPQADDEDAADGTELAPMDANNGGKLAKNMSGGEDSQIWVEYPGARSPKLETLKWAPHHLIPGNASLKRSKVVPYLGDDEVIEKFGSGSKIKQGQTVGYNVNDAANGVWLPSPYALSMKKKWPANPAAKNAYVKAAIDSTNGFCQFHFSHTNYSAAVRRILDELGDKLKLITTEQVCPLADAGKSDKFDAPLGLKPRLDAISSQLRRITSGPRWQPPYTDDTLVEEYLLGEKIKKTEGLVADNEDLITMGTR